MQPFEKIVHYSDPVVTIAVEAKSTSHLPRRVDALRLIARADPCIVFDINPQTDNYSKTAICTTNLAISIDPPNAIRYRHETMELITETYIDAIHKGPSDYDNTIRRTIFFFVFFFKDPSTPDISPLPLPAPLPI